MSVFNPAKCEGCKYAITEKIIIQKVKKFVIMVFMSAKYFKGCMSKIVICLSNLKRQRLGPPLSQAWRILLTSLCPLLPQLAREGQNCQP